MVPPPPPSQAGNVVTQKKNKSRGNRSGQNEGQKVGVQSSDSNTPKFTCFKCGGKHHTRNCTVTSPTEEQTNAGKAAKAAYTEEKAKKDTNATGITSERMRDRQ